MQPTQGYGAEGVCGSPPSQVWNLGARPRLVFIVDVWHPDLQSDEARLAALDAAGQARYRRAAAAVRQGQPLPEEPDLVADRRVRTMF